MGGRTSGALQHKTLPRRNTRSNGPSSGSTTRCYIISAVDQRANSTPAVLTICGVKWQVPSRVKSPRTGCATAASIQACEPSHLVSAENTIGDRFAETSPGWFETAALSSNQHLTFRHRQLIPVLALCLKRSSAGPIGRWQLRSFDVHKLNFIA